LKFERANGNQFGQMTYANRIPRSVESIGEDLRSFGANENQFGQMTYANRIPRSVESIGEDLRSFGVL
jgi:hypothetical protein